MSDPKRLLDGAGDDLEVALLMAGRDEEPSTRAVEKTLLAIGAASTVATGTAAATAAAELASGGAAAAGTAKAATAGAAVAPVVAKASVPVLVAWTGVAAVGSLGTLSAIDYLSEPASPAAVTASAPASAVADERTKPAGRGAAANAVPVAEATEPGEETATAPEPPSATEPAGDGQDQARGVTGDPQANAGGADALRKQRLADEVAALDRARTAVAAGDGAGAVAALDQYDAAFQTKMLGPEARTLRIEALLLAGRGGEARAAAARFLADHPSSTHARRIRSLMAGKASPSQP